MSHAVIDAGYLAAIDALFRARTNKSRMNRKGDLSMPFSRDHVMYTLVQGGQGRKRGVDAAYELVMCCSNVRNTGECRSPWTRESLPCFSLVAQLGYASSDHDAQRLASVRLRDRNIAIWGRTQIQIVCWLHRDTAPRAVRDARADIARCR